MRRTLLICLMMLLPFQWVWAAAASACTHEAEVSATHFGHHAHEHVVGKVNAVADADQGLPGADHADCGVCHLWAAKACVSASLQPCPECGPEPGSAAAFDYDSHVPSGPERPDRSATP